MRIWERAHSRRQTPREMPVVLIWERDGARDLLVAIDDVLKVLLRDEATSEDARWAGRMRWARVRLLRLRVQLQRKLEASDDGCD